MKINWKVRLHNPVFILHCIMALLIPILAYFGLTLKELDSWTVLWETLLKAAGNPYVLGLALFNLWSAINDPTTKGLNDSKNALSYILPK